MEQQEQRIINGYKVVRGILAKATVYWYASEQ